MKKRHSFSFTLQSRLSCLVTVCVLLAPCVAPSQTTKSGSVDWILVLDTSASMYGAGGTRDIFGAVKSSLGEFVRQARLGDSVTLFTFDSDTHPHPTVRITDETDKRDLLREVDQFKAEGNRTHTGKAIRDALERATELGNRTDAEGRTVSIVLFTDGIEDVRGIPDPVSIKSNVQMLPTERPYIFFVSLGEKEHEQQLDELVMHPELEGRGEVVRDPGAQQLSALNERVRKKITVPTPLTISAEPTQVDFGRLEPGETTEPGIIKITSNLATTGTVSIADSNIEGVTLIEPSGSIQLPGGQTVDVPVRLQFAPGLPDGPRSFNLKVEAQAPNTATKQTATVQATVEIAHVPLWRTLIKWLAILIALLLLVIVGFSIFKGDFPWNLWKNFQERNHLEGELEIIRPVPASPESGFLGLRNLRRDRAALSEILGGIGTADGDAELATRHKNGRKLISLNRTAGIVRVNAAEVVTTDLYDGDVIELGNARMRFNWIGHDRPVDPDDNY